MVLEPNAQKSNYLTPRKLRWLLIGIVSNVVRLFLVPSMGAFMLLQYPTVQTYLAQQLTQYLSGKTSFSISIEEVDIDWWDVITLHEVRITDPNGRDLAVAPYIEIDYQLNTLYDSTKISLDQILLNGTHIGLYKGEELNLDWFVRSINEGFGQKGNRSKQGQSRPLVFEVNRVVLENVSLTYEVAGKPYEPEDTFDPNHLEIVRLDGMASNFRIIADTVSCEVKTLQCHEASSGLMLSQFRTNFQYDRHAIQLQNLYASIGESVLTDSLVFSYETPADLSDFIEKVTISANLKESHIAMSDLAKLAPSLQAFQDEFHISGKLEGTVADFAISNLSLDFGEETKAQGKVAFRGLPDLEETYMAFDFENSTLHLPDLQQYLPEFAYQIVRKFGKVSFDAAFEGFLHDFTTRGALQTDIGFLETDINIKPPQNYYRGTLRTADFDLGALAEMPEVLQTITMQGEVEGTGFLLETADLVLDASIEKLGVLGYQYTNIVIDSTHLRKRLFEGEMKVNDPNLTLTVQGDINFQDSTFNFTSQIDTARTYALNLLPTQLDFSTTLKANFKGLTPQDIEGVLEIENQRLEHQGKAFELDSLFISTGFTNEGAQRFLNIDSELLTAEAYGNFEVDKLTFDALQLLQEYQLDFIDNDSTTQAYYQSESRTRLLPQDIRFSAEINEINKLLYLFTDDFYISDNTQIEGLFIGGEVSTFNFSIVADTLRYTNDYELTDVIVQLDAEKYYDSTYFTASADILSAQQKLGTIRTEEISINVRKELKDYWLDSKVAHADSDDFLHFAGKFNVTPEGYQLNLKETDFLILNEDWRSSGTNVIVYADSALLFRDVKFFSGEQSIHVRGVLSENPNEQLEVDITNFDMGFISNYIEGDVQGIAHLDFFVKDPYGERILDFNFIMDSLSLYNFPLGDLKATGEWSQENESLELDAFLLNNTKKIIEIEGSYQPTDSLQSIDMLLSLNGADLAMAQPFIEDNVSNLRGKLIGEIRINGTPQKPILRGFSFIEDGVFTLNYLNTTYTFDDQVYFSNGKIEVRDFELIDPYNQFAYLNGGVFYNSLNEITLGLKGRMQQFLVLNTQETDNELFYGQAYATGEFAIEGSMEQLLLSVNAKSAPNTRIAIPILEGESVENQHFITYLENEADTIKVTDNEEVDISNLRLEFNIEITPDAYCEIIFDKKTGDIIRGTGQGKVKMIMDTKGEFSMFGDVEIMKGAYNFTMLNVIDKKFGVLPNSRISWSGDPYGAELDVTATYTQTASLAPIIQADSSLLNRPEIRRRYPVDVLLGMKGNLLQPSVSFDIDIRDYPATLLVNGVPLSLEGYVAGFEQRIQTDEQELNRQVFSLIILKKLSPEETFSGISQSAGGSVSELLTNQLSYWVSQVDENLEIDLDLDGLNADALNTFQLRLSYSFMDGRLRITRDGAFTNVKNETNVSSLFGDWTIEYLLKPDGDLRAKMYHKHNSHAFNTGLENSSTAGVSVLHTKSFNSFADLFRFSRKKRKKKHKKQNGNE